jgi:hypothetical protein
MTDLEIPRSLTITGNGPDRMYQEQQVLRQHFPNFEFVVGGTGQYAARGILSTEVHLYGIRIEIPSTYPHQLPLVFPVGWTASGPHMYPTGNICVMHPNQWRNAYSIALLVAKAAIWVNKYEIYQSDGGRAWPGNERFHNLVLARSIKKWWQHQ